MHQLQEKLLSLLSGQGVTPLNYSSIGKKIGEPHAQNVKYHLHQLEKSGHIIIDHRKKTVRTFQEKQQQNVPFTVIPILGAANCGQPLAFAEECNDGNLRVSSSIVPQNKNFFALRARGNSLNRADINGKSIEDGDYIVVDHSKKAPNAGDFVVSIIDGAANVKRIEFDIKNGYIVLLSDSTEEHEPIIINEHDDYHVGGVVQYVVKKPRV